MNRLLSRTAIAASVTALVALLSLPTSAASAAASPDEDVTWMVRPSDGVGEDGRAWIELELGPGETTEEHLLVRNLSASTVTFGLTAADGYFTETGRFNMLTSDRESTDAGTWIDIPNEVEVASGADVIVPFTLTVPDNATPGDHPAGVAASIISGSDGQVGIESRIGFRVMTRVAGELRPALSAEASGTYTGSWNPFDAGRLDVGYVVENSGNTRLSVTPEVTVSALFGLVSYQMAGEPIAEMAPGESRVGTVRVPSAWPLFFFSATVDASGSGVGEDASAGEPTTAEASAGIVAIPWSQFAAITLAGLLAGLLWRDRRRRERIVSERLHEAHEQGRAAAIADSRTESARSTVSQ